MKAPIDIGYISERCGEAVLKRNATNLKRMHQLSAARFIAALNAAFRSDTLQQESTTMKITNDTIKPFQMTLEDYAIFAARKVSRLMYRSIDSSDGFTMSCLAMKKKLCERRDYIVERNITASHCMEYREYLNLSNASVQLLNDFSGRK